MRTWLQNYPVVLPALWLLAAPWLLFPTIAPALTAVSLLLLLLLLFTSAQHPLQLSLPRLSLPTTAINSYLLVFLLLTGVAYIVSPLPQVSLPKLTVTILGVITFYLIFPRLNNPEMIERLVIILALSAGGVALVGFFSLEWPERQIIDLQPITDRLPHLSGSFSINHNEMAGTLLLFFPFILAALRKSDGRLKKTVFSIHLVILIVLLLFTQSRGAILGMVVMSLTWLLWGRIPIRKILPFIIIFSLAVLLITPIIGLSLSDLSTWLSTIDAGSKHGDAPPTSWVTRMEIWRVASRMLADYPVVGSGLYTFDPVSRANYVYKTILPNFNLTHAHNLFLQTGTSLGIGGLLALVGIWTTILVRLWKASYSENEQIRHLSAVFAASVTGYLFFNLYDTITFGQKPGLYVWIILAGSVALSQLAQERATANHPAPDKQRFFSVGKLISFAPLLTLIILLLSPAFSRNLANLKLDRAFLQSKTPLTVTAANFSTDARRAGLAYYLAGNDVQALNTWQHDPQGAAFLQSQGVIALMSGKIVSAISWFTLALELAPNSAEIYMWRGMANEERGMLSMAEADFRKAAEFTDSSMLSTETKAYIFYRLGCVLASKHNWPDAAGAFAQAASLEPETSIYYQRLGDALFELGDPAAAETAYERAEQ